MFDKINTSKTERDSSGNLENQNDLASIVDNFNKDVQRSMAVIANNETEKERNDKEAYDLSCKHAN